MLKKIILIIAMLSIGISITEAQSKITKQEVINAIKQGANSTKKLLEKVPIDYYQDDNTLLHYAVQFRKRDVVELLVNRKILISRKGGIFYGTALQEAIYYGHLGIASYLLEKGSLLNIKNIDGDTALHIAARNGYLGIVEQLIAYGASKNMPNANGHTAYNLIPNLSWDSRKKLQEVLSTQPIQVERKNYSKSILNRNIHSTKNRNIDIIDKKSLIDNSGIGIDININRINQF